MSQNIMDAGIAALSVFGASSQYNRLLRMDFQHDDGPRNAIMLINKVKMLEELSSDSSIDAEVLSDDARIPLKKMMGRMVTISLVREEGSLRHMNGYVGTFRFMRTDGGFAWYRMTLQPWLAFAKLYKDNVSFHHRSVIELTESTFAHYRQHDWTTRMSLDCDDRKLTCGGTSGNFAVHAAKHSLPGAKNMDVAQVLPPQAELNGAGTFHLNSHTTAGGKVNAGLPYKLYKDQALVEQGNMDDDGNMTFKHDLDKQSTYHLELPYGNRYAVPPKPQTPQHEVSAAIGYHGYTNPTGLLSEQHASLKQDRLIPNPVSSDGDQPA